VMADERGTAPRPGDGDRGGAVEEAAEWEIAAISS
jgi:hypothetical protein